MTQGKAIEVSFMPGDHISAAAARLVEIAKDNATETFGTFNDVEMRATPVSDPAEIVAVWERDMEAAARAYRESPEGRKAEEERQERRRQAQAKHDALMQQLPTLDWDSAVAVLDWFCAMQEPSDHVGVVVKRDSIVRAAEAHGYKPNMNVGPDFRRGHATNEYEYLIGQCLSGLTEGPAIHSIIHKFAADWKRRFA